MKKTIYVLEIEFQRFFFEDKEKALEVWKLLTDSDIRKLCQIDEYSSSDEAERCYYPRMLSVELKAMKVELCQDKTEAQRVYDNTKKLRKTKILKDK